VVCDERLWLALSLVNNPTCPFLFPGRLPAHRKVCGVRLEQLVVQAGIGSEFGASWNRKSRRPALTELVEPNVRGAGSILPTAPPTAIWGRGMA